MNCRACEAQLSALVDGELTGTQTRHVREHLDHCPACTSQHRELIAVKSLLGGLPTPTLPSDFEEQLVARVMGSTPASARTERRSATSLFLGTVAVAAGLSWAWLQWTPASPRVGQDQAGPTQVDYTVERDQAFLAGGDPALGRAPVWTVGDGPR